MPQKAKFDKTEIITAAVRIIEKDGYEALTARSLGRELGSSARPIFTTFKSMKEVFDGVTAFANDLYQSYVADGLRRPIAFKGVGTSYIEFAAQHPQLFRLLFMKEHDKVPDSKSVLRTIENSYQEILNSITQSYNVSEEFAKRLYINMWIYSHGIATLTVNKMCIFDAEEISDMLTTVFRSLIMQGDKQ